jgi:sulfide:quinone oxidoreductase
MMDIRRLSGEFSVSPQISVGDVQMLWDAGFRSIICNRPDGEAAGQPDVEEIRAEARNLGMAFAFLPAVSNAELQHQAAQTIKLLPELAKPVLAYCRSGTRCTVIWTQMQIGVMPPREILAATSAAGYDMSPLITG